MLRPCCRYPQQHYYFLVCVFSPSCPIIDLQYFTLALYRHAPSTALQDASSQRVVINLLCSDEQAMCGLTDLVSSCLSKASSASSRSTSSGQQHQPFLRASLFTGVPPTIRFYTKGTKGKNKCIHSSQKYHPVSVLGTG